MSLTGEGSSADLLISMMFRKGFMPGPSASEPIASGIPALSIVRLGWPANDMCVGFTTTVTPKLRTCARRSGVIPLPCSMRTRLARQTPAPPVFHEIQERFGGTVADGVNYEWRVGLP